MGPRPGCSRHGNASGAGAGRTGVTAGVADGPGHDKLSFPMREARGKALPACDTPASRAGCETGKSVGAGG